MPRGGEARPGRVLRGRGLPPADDRGGAHEGGGPRHPGARGPGGRDRLRGGPALRRPRAVPGHGRRPPRLRGPRREGPRQRGPPRDGDGPPRPHPPPLAGRAGGGRGARLGAALRGADGLRRAPRRLLRHPGGAQAPHARAAGGRLEGRRGPARVPPVPPDPRAAHPPRQGHQQHLHGAGAARHHGRHVRGLPRPGRPAGDRAARARARARPPAGPAAAGLRRGRRALLRHPARADLPGEGQGDRRAGARGGDEPPVVRGRVGGRRPRRDDAPRGPRGAPRGFRRGQGRLHPRAAGRRGRGGGPRAARPQGRVPPPPRLQPVPRRARDAPLPPAGCRRATCRSRTR